MKFFSGIFKIDGHTDIYDFKKPGSHLKKLSCKNLVSNIAQAEQLKKPTMNNDEEGCLYNLLYKKKLQKFDRNKEKGPYQRLGFKK